MQLDLTKNQALALWQAAKDKKEEMPKGSNDEDFWMEVLDSLDRQLEQQDLPD